MPAFHIFHYSTPDVLLMPPIGNYRHAITAPGLSARLPSHRAAPARQRPFLLFPTRDLPLGLQLQPPQADLSHFPWQVLLRDPSAAPSLPWHSPLEPGPASVPRLGTFRRAGTGAAVPRTSRCPQAGDVPQGRDRRCHPQDQQVSPGWGRSAGQGPALPSPAPAPASAPAILARSAKLRS